MSFVTGRKAKFCLLFVIVVGKDFVFFFFSSNKKENNNLKAFNVHEISSTM
jgi:hypothetical protein